MHGAGMLIGPRPRQLCASGVCQQMVGWFLTFCGCSCWSWNVSCWRRNQKRSAPLCRAMPKGWAPSVCPSQGYSSVLASSSPPCCGGCGGGGGGVSGWRFGGGPLRLDGSQATAAGFRLGLVTSTKSGVHVGASSWHLPASLLAGARGHGVWNRHTGHLGKSEAKLVDGRVAALCPDLAC